MEGAAMNPGKVLILGAARQGQALARFFSAQGVHVVLNDIQQPEALAQARQALSNLPIEWVLGSHPLDLLQGVDLLCLSGGVPSDLPLVRAAQARGIPVSNDSEIFMERVLCPVIGITGSSGKSTTAALVAHIAELAAQPGQKVWLGGNIGTPLVDRLEEIKAGDLVVLELSSFQLEWMSRSPHIAAVLNITPNHLDRHPSFEAYKQAKARILAFQSLADTAILNREDPEAWSLKASVKGGLLTFGLQPLTGSQPGTYVRAGSVRFTGPQGENDLLPLSSVHLLGAHNLANVSAAACIGMAAGLPADSIARGVDSFSGLPHRLETVYQAAGVTWVDDSIATSPERVMAALKSLDQPLVILLGGRDKHLDWSALAREITSRRPRVIVFGEAAPQITEALQRAQDRTSPIEIHSSSDLRDAVSTAGAIARRGDVVLLSPGATSFDEFRDFEERGSMFAHWAKAAAGERA